VNRRRLIPLLALALLALAPASRAQTWLPLDDGFFWAYAGSFAAETRTVEGTVVVLGEPAKSILYSPSSSNEGLRNFWSTAADGDVLLHGFLNPAFGGWGYDPPIVMLDAPLFVGKTWQQTSDGRDLVTGDLLFTLEIAFQVFEEGVLAVPAGSFDTFGIGQIAPRRFVDGTGAVFGLDGERITDVRGGTASQYYSQNVGLVRDIADDTYDLLAYGSPTAVESRSWAGVKDLYR
jgi:hypothetical protein